MGTCLMLQACLLSSRNRFREKRFQDLRREFLSEFEEAVRLDEALAPHLAKAQDDLNPIRVLHIFSKMVPEVQMTFKNSDNILKITIPSLEYPHY